MRVACAASSRIYDWSEFKTYDEQYVVLRLHYITIIYVRWEQYDSNICATKIWDSYYIIAIMYHSMITYFDYVFWGDNVADSRQCNIQEWDDIIVILEYYWNVNDISTLCVW